MTLLYGMQEIACINDSSVFSFLLPCTVTYSFVILFYSGSALGQVTCFGV